MSHVDEQVLSRQLREEVDSLAVPSALEQGWPRDLAGIRARGRRRRLLRVHGARAGSVLAAAAVAGVLVATWPGTAVDSTAPSRGGPAAAPSTSASDPSVLPPAPTGTAAVTVEGLVERTPGEPCAVGGTLTRATASDTILACGDAPAAVAAPLERADWFTGYPSSPGLQLVDGVPAWVSEEFSDDSSDLEPTGLRVVVPSIGVSVLLFGTPEESDELLGALRLGGAPADTADRSARASDEDPVRATLTTASGEQFGLTRDADTIAAVTGLLDGAGRPAAPGCFPALADTAQLDLQTAEDSDPATGPVSEYTYLVVDTSGTCDLVYSSTGAVLQVDAGRFTPLLDQLLASSE